MATGQHTLTARIEVTLGTADRLAIVVKSGPLFTDTVDLIKGFPERKWSAQDYEWRVPLTENNVAYLRSYFLEEEMEIDDEARVAISYIEKTREFEEKKARRRWEYLFNDKVHEVPHKFHTEPYRHQTVALDSMHNAEYFALLMEMGTGKTKVVLDEALWCARESDDPYRVLIVAPKSLLLNWRAEIGKHLPEDFPTWVGRLRTGVKGLELLLDGVRSKARLQFYLVNYERIRSILEPLKKFNFDLCVLDESTRIKNPNAKRTKATHELGQACKRRAVLTGTPVTNNVYDLFSQFQFLQPGSLGFNSYYAYKNHYSIIERWKAGERGGQREKLHGFKNLDELKRRLSRCSFVVKKAQCLDLPDKTYTTRAVEMTPKQAELYKEMEQWLIAALNKEFQDASKTSHAAATIVKLLRLAQITCGFLKSLDGTVTPIPGGNPKLDELVSILENDVDPDHKVLVWARFRQDIKVIEEALAKYNPVVLHGGIKAEQRFENAERFNNDPSVRVLIGEPSTGGLGLNLVGSAEHPCTTTVYYSNDFSLEKRLQSEDRCHRSGMHTKSAVTYIDLVCEDTIDERIAMILQSKKSLSEAVKDLSTIKELLLGKRRTQ